MKIYAYEAPGGGLFFRVKQFETEINNYKFIGGVDLIFEKPKKIVQMKQEFKTHTYLHNDFFRIPRDAKNIVVYYDVEE
jgi:hypothetical protein